MTDTKPEGPYRIFEADGKFVVDVPGLLLQSKNKPDAEMWVEAFNMAHDKGFKAGRASRDGLREALQAIASELYVNVESATRCRQIAKQALAEDEKEGR